MLGKILGYTTPIVDAPKRFAEVNSFSRYRYMDRSVPAFNHDAPFKITDGKRLKIERAQRERSLDVQHCQT